MLAKLLIILFIFSQSAQAQGIGDMVTQAQLDSLCVRAELSIDDDYHWFYYKTITAFTQQGMTITNKSKVHFFPRNEILNFDEVYAKWQLLEKNRP